MPPLQPCGACGRHVRADACGCPHCGQPCSGRGTRFVGALLMGLAVSGCRIVQPEPDYGVLETGTDDFDDDGWSEADGDCDDDDETVHPGAEETPGDGVDSNCNGEDDT